MKTVSLFAVLAIAVCLIGCEKAELVTCQQDKDLLQGQLEQANAAIAKKDSEIAAIEAKNVEDQNTAMASITTMMTKQAEKDNQLKQKLAERAQQIKSLKMKIAELEAQIDTHVCPAPEASDHADGEDGDGAEHME